MRYFLVNLIFLFTLAFPAQKYVHAQSYEGLENTVHYDDRSLRDIQNYDPMQAFEKANSHARNTYKTTRNSIEQMRQWPHRDVNNASQDNIKKEPPPSALEKMYSRRTVEEPKQFGYDMFNRTDNDVAKNKNDAPIAPSGMVQDDYILGTGDILDVMFTGQRTDRDTYKVNASGMVIVPDLPPVNAAGRTLNQVRGELESYARILPNTKTYVALSAMRQIGVLVVGHVKNPGRQNLNIFHTPLDAIMQAGGIEKTGSLRQVKLVRSGRSQIIDLYALLLHGADSASTTLRDGDRIIIPSIGPTIAISGEVKRPGIFEIRPTLRGMYNAPDARSEYLSLNDMLALSGGVMSPGKNRFLKLGINNHGQETVDNIDDEYATVFGDGAILVVSKGDAKRVGMIELTGHARTPGLFDIKTNPSLGSVLSSESVLGKDIYPLLGVIERWNPKTLSSELDSFPVNLTINGQYDTPLKDGDVIHLFSNTQIRNLQKPLPNFQREQGSHHISDDDIENDYITDKTLNNFLQERGVFVRGAVRHNGVYPVSHASDLNAVISAAGGTTIEASKDNVEVTGNDDGLIRRRTFNIAKADSLSTPIAVGDSVRVNQKFKRAKDKSVLIAGEVVNPGQYDLLPGDRLSDLLERAGGYNAQAYPDGVIFSRASERRAEEARYKAQARQIKQSIAAALEMRASDKKDEKINAAKIAEARALADELEDIQGIGRITVEADSNTLKTNQSLDTLLHAGDKIYVPKRTLNVRVSGEVLSPANLQFRESKDPLDYINQAGGFTFHADKDRSFVLYPDGSAQPLHVSAWNHNSVMIPPGSTIIVPRDPEPFNFIQSAKDISQILSNLAVTAIFVDDISDSR